MILAKIKIYVFTRAELLFQDKGIAAVARDTGVPVIFGVLTTDTMQQALERAGIKSNLGWSYGLQALEMGSLMASLSAAD